MKDLVVLKEDFERCWPWLWASLCESGSPTHNKENVWQRLCTGTAFMWACNDCVIVGTIIDHPIGYRSFNYWLQGGHLQGLLAMHPEIEAWAKEAGCSQVTGFGRTGWSRVMNGEWRKGPTPRQKWLGDPPRVVRKALLDD